MKILYSTPLPSDWLKEQDTFGSCFFAVTDDNRKLIGFDVYYTKNDLETCLHSLSKTYQLLRKVYYYDIGKLDISTKDNFGGTHLNTKSLSYLRHTVETLAKDFKECNYTKLSVHLTSGELKSLTNANSFDALIRNCKYEEIFRKANFEEFSNRVESFLCEKNILYIQYFNNALEAYITLQNTDNLYEYVHSADYHCKLEKKRKSA